MTLTCTVSARISAVDPNGWSVATADVSPEQGRPLDVRLEVTGNDAAGYHLIMEPAGCLAADTWHETLDAAMSAAAELFGTRRDSWTGLD